MSPFDPPALSISLAGVRVFIAVPVNRDFPWQYDDAMVHTACLLKDKKVPFLYRLLANGSIIQVVRSKLAHEFLKSDCTHLFMIDSDMEWKPEDFARVLALATKMPVVGAAYPIKKDPGRTFLIHHASNELEANEWGCMPIKGFGLGFTCVQRQVIEALSEKAPLIREDNGETYRLTFNVDFVDGVLHGEDMKFFADCKAAGFEVHVDPSVELGHVGSKSHKGRLKDALFNHPKPGGCFTDSRSPELNCLTAQDISR